MARGRDEVGDGDVCPLVPSHGRMLFVNGSTNQYCPHQSHDGVWGEAGTVKTEPSRAFWPKGHDSFRRAVIQATLPQIDIALLGG